MQHKTRQQVLSTYKALLRIIHNKFHNDQYILNNAIQQVRIEYRDRMSLNNSFEIQVAIQNAREAMAVIQDDILVAETMNQQQQQQQNSTNEFSSPDDSYSSSNVYKAKLSERQIIENLDQNVYVQEIDEDLLNRLERKSGREERRKERLSQKNQNL